MKTFRGGLEDLHYAKIFEAKLAANPSASWAEEVKGLLAVPDEVVTSFTAFTDDPVVYQTWRDRMADLIEEEH
ncbi:MAG TPA: hypothetical protein PKI32_09555 [Opitutales bacterium]|nr:hypothetical protein [Opitutales bacterium]